MKGIGRTLLLLLCWGALQRWLVGIGLILTVSALGALTSRWHPEFQDWFRLQLFLGVALVLISPVLVGGVVFRSLSAARAVALIPNGRLKLVLGAFASHLLLALLAGSAVSQTRAEVAAPVFATVFTVLNLQFFGYYWSSQYRLGGLWLLSWVVWMQLLIAAFKTWQLRAWLNSATGLWVALLINLCAWLVFATLYLRSRRIGMPLLDGFLVNRSASKASDLVPRYSQRYAARTLLLGIPPWTRRTMWPRLLWGTLIILLVCVPFQLQGAAGNSSGNSLAWVPILVIAGPLAWSFAFRMTQRARLLWLSSGLARRELFRMVESYSWRLMLISICVVMLLTIPRFLPGIRDLSTAAQLVTFMAIPFAAGGAFLYAGMSYVSGRKLAGTLIVAVCTAFWLVNLGFPLSGAAAPAPALLALQIALVPVLRVLALRQWQDIDWLLNRPKRLPARIA
jgi:hypothetical protein